MGQLPAHTTTGNLPSTLNQQLSEVTDLLTPASADAIASAILKLHRAGMAYPPAIDPHRAGDVYGYALKGLAIEGLKRALEKIIRGQIPKLSGDFIPTPPALAAIVRIECAALWADRDRILTAIESMQPVVKPTPSQEQRERVRALVQMVKDNAEEFRRATMPKKEEIEADFEAKYRGLIRRPSQRDISWEETGDDGAGRDWEENPHDVTP